MAASEQVTMGKWQWANDSEHIYKFANLHIYKFAILQIYTASQISFYKYERQLPPQGALMASSEQVAVGNWQWANGSVHIINLQIYILDLQIYHFTNSSLYIWKTNASSRSSHGFIWARSSEQVTVSKWQWANGSE